METEKNSEESTRFQKDFTKFFIAYLLFLLVGISVEGYGILHEGMLLEKLGNLIITAISVGVTVTMVYFIAVQTMATRDMVKKASIQARLTYETVAQMMREIDIMNESLIEMKKQRLNIEEFKNSLVGYLQYLIGVLTANCIGNRAQIQEPYPYLRERYHRRIKVDFSPAEEGLIWRISVFIEKFLEAYGFSLQEVKELNKVVSKFNDHRTPREEKPVLANIIKEKSQDLLKIAKSIFDETETMGDKKLEEEILKILES